MVRPGVAAKRLITPPGWFSRLRQSARFDRPRAADCRLRFVFDLRGQMAHNAAPDT
jgi:hypothetical protein